MSISAPEELAAATALTAEEYGACILLRLYQWEYGALPTDEDRLARIAHVATDRWPAVSAEIRSRFGPNWLHEVTQQAHEKASATRALLSKAGRKGGRTQGKAKPNASLASALATRQAVGLDTSQAVSLASAGLKPDALPRDGEASRSAQAGDQIPYPAISDPDAARVWLLERSVFPGDLDELQCLLMAGKLTPAILEPLAR
ncbi:MULTISPECIES: hypothetical protein [Kaistia]|uniref:DUF1376 domain-containing protein n=1 Tax=Kaistia nematophila TaxID=2994654 RepID=A0A9X3E7M0_9HYPH|nr:hypothetical protein [Kaistia nematophila]MCX5568165.1 hypothetical protein [Kaistia nematophila]